MFFYKTFCMEDYQLGIDLIINAKNEEQEIEDLEDVLSYKFTNDFFGTDIIKIINEIKGILANYNIKIEDVDFFRITLTTKSCEFKEETKK